MLKFLFGFAVGVVVVLAAGFCYVRFGFVDPRADIPVGWLESKIAMPALDAAVNRRAPEAHNTLQPTDDTLMAGMKTYETNCASCHGDIQHPHALLAGAFILAHLNSSKTRQTCPRIRTSTSSSTAYA